MTFLGRTGLCAGLLPFAAVLAACSGSSGSDLAGIFASADAGIDGSMSPAPDRGDAAAGDEKPPSVCTSGVTCASAGATCGKIPDGCGGIEQCGICPSPLSCGGGGMPNQCGLAGCVRKTCTQANAQCGSIADGCGGTLACGTCIGPLTCGGGGVANECGSGQCVATTCASAGATCGPIGDGCGNTLNCGACTAPQTCGGSGVANVCGGGCVVKTCAQQGFTCGTQGDGCGGTLDCGSCVTPQTCGGSGTAGACGAGTCVAKTCAQIGAQCGSASDGCGNLLDCGACPGNETCGSGGTANVCGSCTTTVSGTVYAPGHATDPAPPAIGSPDPLPNVLVYIPSSPVAAFTPGVSCNLCTAPSSGTPVTSVMTDTKGHFVLSNVPVRANVPLVIQTGRWRRQVVIPSVTSCRDTALPQELTRLPRNKTEGDIPAVAISTGVTDMTECIFKRLGVDDSEVTLPTASGGTGRIQLYLGNGGGTSSGGSTPVGGSVIDDDLWGSTAALSAYDMVIFGCEGAEYPRTPAALANLVSYTSAGGRVLLNHYSYVWLNTNAPFMGTATWAVDGPGPDDGDSTLQTNFTKGATLASWLLNVGASTTSGSLPMTDLRSDITAVNAPAKEWIASTAGLLSGVLPLDYTFNTPVANPPAQQCGRVHYADYHAAGSPATNGVYPTECSTAAMTPQEKLLEYTIFDLGACLSPD